jgi:hypothetical protein
MYFTRILIDLATDGVKGDGKHFNLECARRVANFLTGNKSSARSSLEVAFGSSFKQSGSGIARLHQPNKSNEV